MSRVWGRHCPSRIVAAGVMAALGVAGCWHDDASRSDAPPSNAPTDAGVATVNPANWPRPAQPAFDDRAHHARIDELLRSLTVEEKVGQIIQADLCCVTPEDVRQYRLGSILVGGNSGPNGDDLAPAPKWLEAADAFYAASMDTSGGKHAIPILWGVDAVHGHNNIIGATLFPHNVALGATRNPELIERIGEITARELRVTGQEWTFAPTIAVAQDIRWGRSYESYSENPEIFAAYASAMVRGLQGTPGTPDFLRGEHVIATVKHYVGDGGTQDGRDQGDNRASEAELRDIHAAGYPAAISAGVQVVMASFNSWHGEKLHGHKGLLNDVLKERMGFSGFVVGDWNGHGQVRGCSNVSCPASINAGLDMFMAPDSWKELYENTLAQVRSGQIPMSRLDDAVRRVLLVKLRAGLFEAGPPSSRPLAGQFDLLGAPEHRAVARQAVRESLVLLKNSKGVLPIKPNARVLVAGDGAHNIPKQNGGWTLTWQGTGITNEHFPNAESIFQGIQAAVKAAGGTAILSESGSYTVKPDVAIVVYGEDPYAEFQGDVDTLEYQPGDKRDLALLKKLRADGIPVVSVFLSGRPMWVNPEINASDAFVAAWLPGSEGGGIADVLFAKPDGSINYDFKGKLSFSWPRTPTQTKANPGSEPFLFPYGYGLTYRDDGELPTLPEEISTGEKDGTSARVYFAQGRPGTGWTLTVSDAQGVTPLEAATGRSAGGVLSVRAIDHTAQEDARLATWSGAGAATLSLQGAAPLDLQREANGQLSLAFAYRVDAPPSKDVVLAVECGANCRGTFALTDHLRAAPVGEWRQLKVLLQCFQKTGAEMHNVTAPFAVSTDGTLTLGVSNVRLETGVADAIGCD
jgi:beta-glucosidase